MPPPRRISRLGEERRAAVVVLGSSPFDLAVERLIRRSGLPCWGRGGESTRGLPPADGWFDELEHSHDYRGLCQLFGAVAPPREELVMRPPEAARPSIEKVGDKRLVGAHCLANWPAKSYPHRTRLLEMLRDELDVWVYDEVPCPSISSLAWIMRASEAVLTVDSMALHLARALGVLTLSIQGPVWKHPDEAPYLIPGTRITAAPVPLTAIDRGSSPLAAFPPEYIAGEFVSFLNAKDRSRWRAS